MVLVVLLLRAVSVPRRFTGLWHRPCVFKGILAAVTAFNISSQPWLKACEGNDNFLFCLKLVTACF